MHGFWRTTISANFVMARTRWQACSGSTATNALSTSEISVRTWFHSSESVFCAPKSIVHTLKIARTSVSRQPPGVDQAALAEFIADGRLERHIRATLQIYRGRYEALVHAIRQYGGGVLEVSENSGIGMYLVAWLPAGVDDRVAARIASAAGVDTVPLSDFALHKLRRSGLVLGYSAYNTTAIREAAQRLCRALLRVYRA
jgi:GntR family transcriptional regulator / MocR family aminotransferase